MAELEIIRPQARALLTVESPAGKLDLFLWEHTARVARCAMLMTFCPELAEAKIDRVGLLVAAYFHDVGWASQIRQGRAEALLALTRPSSELELALSASQLREQLSGTLGERTIELAGQIIRQMNDRQPERLEAAVLGDADNLDLFGPLLWWREVRRCLAEGRDMEQVITSWMRQREYHYWQARINEGLRFESSRQLARRRLAGLEMLMAKLESEHSGRDIQEFLAAAGVTLPREELL